MVRILAWGTPNLRSAAFERRERMRHRWIDVYREADDTSSTGIFVTGNAAKPLKRDDKKTSAEIGRMPVETTLRIIGGKWKVLIIHFLIDDKKRFGGLLRSMRTISTRTLSKQLSELEADGIVHRRDFREIPPHVEYSLTPLGKSLEPILRAMEAWGLVVRQSRIFE